MEQKNIMHRVLILILFGIVTALGVENWRISIRLEQKIAELDDADVVLSMAIADVADSHDRIVEKLIIPLIRAVDELIQRDKKFGCFHCVSEILPLTGLVMTRFELSRIRIKNEWKRRV